MPKNRQMQFLPNPEISLLQSAINEVTEKEAIAGNKDKNLEAIAPSPSDGVRIKINNLLDDTENYSKVAFELITEDIPTEEVDEAADNKFVFESTASEANKNPLKLSPDAVMNKLNSSAFGKETPLKETLGFEKTLSVPAYCTNLAVKFAQARLQGNTQQAEEYFAQLHMPMGNCDSHFITEVSKVYAKFLFQSHILGKGIPYRKYDDINDFVINDRLAPNATIAIIGDWGTGQEAAFKLLKQIKKKEPDVIIHLGDIYYSGTQYEVDNYFIKPFNEIFNFNGDFQSKKPAIFNLTGNHDMYSGGQAYYDLIDKLGQPSSYFCLRNEKWQFLAMDTGYNSRLGGGNTYLQEEEVIWLKDKIENFDGKTVLLSHHQLFSADDSFDDKEYNQDLYHQVEAMLGKIDVWFWGHEHNMVIYNPYLGLERGRCLGASAFPVGKDEVVEGHKFNVPFVTDAELLLSSDSPFYQHSYAIMKLSGEKATIDYYQDSNEEKALYSEEIA